MMVELFVPLGLFVMITVCVSFVTRLIATGSLHKTLREAIRSDPASVPILAARLDERQPWADALLGWLFLTFAVVLAALAFFEYEPERTRMLKAAVIPAVLGVVTLVYINLARPRNGRATVDTAH